MDLRLFKKDDLFKATLSFFRDTIGLQLQTKSKMPIDLGSQFETFGIKSKKVEEVWNHVDKTYYIGLLDDNNFEKEIAEQEKSDLEDDLEDVEQSDDEYPGILIFAVDLNDGFNPTRSNLTEINRTLNRFSQRVPVLVLARYGNKISLMLADRVAYKQEWREGEKVRKVSLLRDIDLDKPHAGHLRILKDLVVPTSGTKEVESFDGLYEYWKEVLDTSELNKKFYQDLSNWYFWAIKHVRFPDEPTAEDAHKQDKERDDMLQEHRATNVIRLLTRLLFVWFIKEKGLIPEELFDLKTLQQDILKEITPYHETGMFKEANKESIYYKAILQNLFFATLNCPIEASSSDDRERGFRSTTRGVHFGVTYLMRYEQYFKEKEKFLDLVNSKVPFLNGGLFECLDERGAKEDKDDRVWVDGFSDNLPNEHKIIVPDFLFFGVEEEVDLSEDYGLKSKKYKEAAVRGLLNIFKSYKFTITENTPIEEDVALDPELLGKVFENLLASYNPETKTTARKQTGSFYTPREIVNYMVDESLIAYLKNEIEDWGVSEEDLDEKLHQLTSYEETVPFKGNKELHHEIITALSNCTILDPACGSGAFPMGILQKMVHILQKLDTDNEVWKEVQKEKASKEADQAITEIEDKEERGQRLQEINEAFDERMNAPDYARKLFLIENCIYGVDIQPVATQISKLRFFISLVVEQKVGDEKSNNFGIRPLPNLETKFVAANTLIDIKDIGSQGSLSYTKDVEKLHNELRQVRSKLFSARTTDTKHKYRQRDEELRQTISKELMKSGMPDESANKLAKWDPYDQNFSSSFFNSEWMFDILNGFDIVIGNPPYRSNEKFSKEIKNKWSEQNFTVYKKSGNIYFLFYEKGFEILKKGGVQCLITSNQWLRNKSGKPLRKLFSDHSPIILIDFKGTDVFNNVAVLSNILLIRKASQINEFKVCDFKEFRKNSSINDYIKENTVKYSSVKEEAWLVLNKEKSKIKDRVIKQGIKLSKWDVSFHYGFRTGYNKAYIISSNKKEDLIAKATKNKDLISPILRGKDIGKYHINFSDLYIIKALKGMHNEIVSDYPEMYSYLETHKESLSQRAQVKNGSHHWLELDNSPTKDYVRYFQEQKIIFPNMTKGMPFYYDEVGYLTNQKCYIIRGEHLTYLTAIFNSKLFKYCFKDNFPELLGDVRELGKTYMLKIPIKKPDSSLSIYLSSFDFTVKAITDLIKRKVDTDLFENIIDAIVLNLYFQELFKTHDLEVINIIHSDINNFSLNRNYNALSNSEKQKVIEQLHERWLDPENEVRKRINSFPEKSPDILKPILEG